MNQVADLYSNSHGRRLVSEYPLEDNQVGYFMVAYAILDDLTVSNPGIKRIDGRVSF